MGGPVVVSRKHPGIYSAGVCLISNSLFKLSCQYVNLLRQLWIRGLATGSSLASKPATYKLDYQHFPSNCIIFISPSRNH